MGKFNEGDTVSVEGTVTYMSVYGVDFKTAGGDTVTVPDIGDVKLVKKATPPAPAAGTILDLWGAKYVVTHDGSLLYLRVTTYGGPTVELRDNGDKWSMLDHSIDAKYIKVIA